VDTHKTTPPVDEAEGADLISRETRPEDTGKINIVLSVFNFNRTHRKVRYPQLQIGSDQEIANLVVAKMRQDWGEVPFAEGKFWRFDATH